MPGVLVMLTSHIMQGSEASRTHVGTCATLVLHHTYVQNCSVSPSHPPPEWFRQLSVYATTACILPPAQVDLGDHTDAAAAHIYASYQQQLRDRRQVSASFPGEGCAIERSSVTPPTKPSSAGNIYYVLPWLWLHYLRVSLCREEIAFVVRSWVPTLQRALRDPSVETHRMVAFLSTLT